MKIQPGILTLAISFILSNHILGQTGDIKYVINTQYDYIENLYKHFHAHPELSMKEENTSKRLAGELRQLGFSVIEKIGGFGVVAVLENGDGPVVMMRTDMDALPIKEETGVDVWRRFLRVWKCQT